MSEIATKWPALLVICLLFNLVQPSLASEPSREDLDYFENHVRPLLVKHCYECHSDPKQPDGELLLNSRGAILEGGASGPSAHPGKPKESLLIEAIQYRSLEMPPNGKLAQAEIDHLVRWVEMGLPWPEEENESGPKKDRTFQITAEQKSHWAFLPVSSPEPPQAGQPEWNRNPVDQFVYEKLVSQGLKPNELADRATLLRRVSYNLTGLPPSPEELGDFLDDQSPNAWEKVVERLLASPHYGERWGRHWLDVVRYADTAGDASDYPVPDAYKYRNYVIDSFNRDKPYDQFLREQYAGDLLAKDASAEQFSELTVATTHLALARRFGYNDTNFYYFHLTINDLLDTMGQAVLGLSIGCARCHDHKFEPISARDYYALYGIFSSSKFTFPGAEEVRHPKDLIPLVREEVAQQLQQQRNAALAEIDQRIFEKSLPILDLEGSFEGGKSLAAPWRADSQAKLVATDQSPYTNVFPAGSQVMELPNLAANLGFRRPIKPRQRSADTNEPLHINLDFRNVSVEAGGDGYYRICLDHVTNYSPALELFVNANGVYARDGEGLKELVPLGIGQWYNLQLTVDWQNEQFSGRLADGSRVWEFSEIRFNPKWDGIVDSFVIDAHGTDNQKVRPLRQIDNLALRAEPFAAVGELASLNLADLQTSLKQLREVKQAVEKEKQELSSVPVYPTAYAVNEGTPGDTPLQFRGEPERLGETVPRGFLEILGGQTLPAGTEESGRRQLADWLASPENPLTSRVMVNRIWHYHFGRGLVGTPNDFGTRGEKPSHPELLDFLANEFRKNGYSIKAMHRLILNSRTYQLASTAQLEAEQTDPENRWLWRHSPRRLDAESLRDSLLLFAGELDLTPGESHPFPPISAWRFSQHNPFDAVYESPKRTVYLMTQRIKRHPFLALFDGADPNATTGKREYTTTPAQALFLMNAEFMHLRSSAIAKRLLAENEELTDCLKQLYLTVYSRAATAEELQAGRDFCEQYSRIVPETEDQKSSSLSAYARVLLSSNEFLHLE